MAKKFIYQLLCPALVTATLALTEAAGPTAPAMNLNPATTPGVGATPKLQLMIQDGQLRPTWEFWRSKPELLKKIRDDRTISVSVHRKDLPSQKVEFEMTGVGLVNRPRDFCFVMSQKYEKLPEVSEHFKNVHYDPASRQLQLTIEILSYQARMTVLITAVDGPVSGPVIGPVVAPAVAPASGLAAAPSRYEMQWQVIDGTLKGMTGLVGYESEAEKATWMSFHASYQANELPLPKVLMGFTLEVITEKIAQKMRSFIEAQPQAAVVFPPATGL